VENISRKSLKNYSVPHTLSKRERQERKIPVMWSRQNHTWKENKVSTGVKVIINPQENSNKTIFIQESKN